MNDLALGTRVIYHHRAGVARFTTMGETHRERRWVLFEGVLKNEVSRHLDSVRDLFRDASEIKTRWGSVNKTVMLWPEEGSGVVIGKVKRGRGTSTSGSGGSSYFGEDYEPGYFSATDFFELYAVKLGLQGTEYILVPTWAVNVA